MATKHLKKFYFFAFILAVLLPGFALHAQVSVNVNTMEPVYRDIDKLVANGLVYKIIMGQRPFSRKEVARITTEALHNLPRLEEKLQDPKLSEKDKEKVQERLDYLRPILNRLKKDYHEELVQLGALEGEKYRYSWHVVEDVTVDAITTNSPARTLNNNNGLGSIDAVINPLLQNQQGRHLIEGTNLSLESAHWARVTDYFAAYFMPRFQLGLSPDANPNDNNVYVLNLYGKFNIKNFELEVGRDNLLWGQGLNSGLLLSNNPRGLDMAKISNDSPFILPWVFRYLGAHKLSFYYADLGPEQFFPNSYLTGYKWSWLPISFFEFGLAMQVEGGGKGSPDASFGKRVGAEFWMNPETNGQDISNKIGGFDMRFRIPPLRGTELYLETMFEDRHNNLFSSAQWVDDAAYVAGLYLPRLNNTGSLDLRFEYHRTGPRFYRHATFQSGLTENQFITGDYLGPNAQGVYGYLNWDVNSKNILSWLLSYEGRSNDTWTADNTSDFNLVKVQSFPIENRYRVGTTWLHRFEPFPLDVKLNASYERVNNFNFAAGDDLNNYLAQISFQFNFDQWTRSLKN